MQKKKKFDAKKKKCDAKKKKCDAKKKKEKKKKFDVKKSFPSFENRRKELRRLFKLGNRNK